MIRTLIIIFLICTFSVTNGSPLINNSATKTNQSELLPVQKRVLQYLNAKKWNELFPHRFGIINGQSSNNFYSFNAFLKALQYFPDFLNTTDKIFQKRELAAFLANMAYETGGGWPTAPDGYFKWGLHFVEEQRCPNGCQQYSDTSKKNWMPVPGKSYHGRGPLQLSWNYNYGQFSEFLFGNKDSLLQHPEIVANNAVVSFASAFWFWMHPQKPKPSCHEVMAGIWKPNAYDSSRNILYGFGTVINIINGGIECGNNKPYTQFSRMGYYQYFCNYLHVTPGPNIGCANQKPFNSVL